LRAAVYGGGVVVSWGRAVRGGRRRRCRL